MRCVDLAKKGILYDAVHTAGDKLIAYQWPIRPHADSRRFTWPANMPENIEHAD
jgi:hypothetical protein